MAIEDTLIARLNELIDEGEWLRRGNEHGQVLSEQHAQECRGWLAAATNIVQLVIPDPNSWYRRNTENIAGRNYGYVIQEAVGEVKEILVNLLKDSQAGLVLSVGDNARAEVFDDFLDHAKAYLHDGRKNEAGVISGVVFEDSIRRVCDKLAIAERGEKLDGLISELVKNNVLSATKAKRARVAAHVRTKATHAQWDEYDEDDLKTAIDFTEEFIANHVDK